jgi:hypothetical protein
MKLAAACASLVLTTASAAIAGPAPATPDAERAALGRRLAAELSPLRTQVRVNEATGEVFEAWTDARLREGTPDCCPATPQIRIAPLDLHQLYASLEAGAASVAPRLADADGAYAAGAYDTRTLKVLVAFYGSPAERAMQAKRTGFMDQAANRSLEMAAPLMRGPPSGSQAADEVAKVVSAWGKLGSVAQTPDEAAFGKSPAGKAFASGEAANGAHAPTPWPEMIAAAEDDYCHSKPCDEAAHGFFADLAAADFEKINDPAAAAPADASPTLR